MRSISLTFIALAAAAAAVACYDNDDVIGGDAGSGAGAGADTSGDGASGDGGADDGSGGGPVFTTCTDNLDCRGGEVCRGGFCREACSDGDPCVGALTVCEPVLGFCVECVTDGDCGTNYLCAANACSFYCVNSDDCADGTVCDVDTGSCIEPQCTDDSECPGGFACRSFACEPIDEPICEPETQRCEGNVVVTCSRDGATESRLNCAASDICVYTGETTAACRTVVCEPNTQGCSDANTRFACDSTGTILDQADCDAGEFCTDGFCARQACEPNTTRCEGDTLAACDSLGSSETFVACDDTVDCLGTPFGCYCAAGDCSARVCEPTTVRCVGPGYQTCDASGASWGTVASCPAGQSCSAGACR